jgi:hypothetical protein
MLSIAQDHLPRHIMAHPGFGHLWKQTEMSDMNIVIACAQDAASAGDENPEEHNSTLLQQLPGHSMILSSSPYFKAQASADCISCVLLRLFNDSGGPYVVNC